VYPACIRGGAPYAHVSFSVCLLACAYGARIWSPRGKLVYALLLRVSGDTRRTRLLEPPRRLQQRAIAATELLQAACIRGYTQDALIGAPKTRLMCVRVALVRLALLLASSKVVTRRTEVKTTRLLEPQRRA
jgi:hypothetical protein